MNKIFGLILMIVGVILGLYVGVVVLFIGGIIGLIYQVPEITSGHINTAEISYGILKIVFSGFVGWFVGFVPIIFGFNLFYNSDE